MEIKKKAGRKKVINETNIVQIAYMLYVQDMSYKAVAAELGCDQRTLMKYKSEMIAALKSAQDKDKDKAPSLISRLFNKNR